MLTLPVPPSANRYWRHFRGRTVLSKDAVQYKEQVGWAARAAGLEPLAGEISVTLHWYRSRKSGDLDNKIKCLLDSLQGHAYLNDSQIIAIHAYRHDSDKRNPRVEVTVETTT
jgi:crossover junction endodeoxyribonuclease RusA